jgi:hypothetical protein
MQGIPSAGNNKSGFLHDEGCQKSFTTKSTSIRPPEALYPTTMDGLAFCDKAHPLDAIEIR